MLPSTESPIVVHRRREHDGLSVDDRRLRRAVDSGAWRRVVAGSYVATSEWRALSPMERHRIRVLEALARTRSPVVVAFFAAAAVWSMDLLGTWPALVDVRTDRRPGGRSTGVFRRRALGLDDVETVAWNGHRITTPAQTAVDLAHVVTFTQGVVALDQALWARRPGGALASMVDLQAARDRTVLRSGFARAGEAVAFATPLADSVRESQSRVVLDRLGFPTPVLQQPFALTAGRTSRVDFWFPGFRHIGEFDGAGKYVDPVLRGGRSAEEVLMQEKDREDELRRQVKGLSRWRTADLRDPRRLFDILTAAGVPSTRSRPRLGQVWQ